MHLQAHHIGGISTIIPNSPTNPVAASRATTTPNINNPPKSKVKKGTEKENVLANKGWMFRQRGSKKCRILQVNRVMRSKMYREISKGIFNQKKACVC